MRVKIDTNDLQLGMYVDELDRPWLETPFLFQGFPIREQKELDLLRQYCRHVYVFSERSEHPRKNKKESPHRFQTRQLNITQHNQITQTRQDHRALVTELKNIKKTYDQSHSYVTQVLNDVRLGNSINIEHGKQLVETLTDSIIKNENALALLTQLKEYDEYTVRHSINVCIMSLLFGKHLGLNAPTLRNLGLGALLHDIGKMRLPDDLLNKPDRLTEIEFARVRMHPEYGCQILAGRPEIGADIIDIVRSHHERIDGSGYPNKLKADELGALPMIVSIVDVYDAITTKRCYHDGISPHEALRLMYESEIGAFRHDLLDKYIQCLSIFPVGSIVELDNGEIAIVMSVNRSKHLLPVILLVMGPDKQPYYPRKVCNLEFMADKGSPLRIKRILESNAHGINVTKILFEENNFNSLELL